MELVIKGLINKNRPKNPYNVLEVTQVNIKKDLLALEDKVWYKQWCYKLNG